MQLPPTTHAPRQYVGADKETIRALRQQYVSPSVFTIYADPIMIVEGYMQYVWDEQGTRYLDMLAGIATVGCGHCHPRVTEKINEQVRTLQHATTIYLHPHLPQLAQRISDQLPDGLDVTFFANSGSEANELAVNMARMYTGNVDVIALRNAYHGLAASTLGMTGMHSWKYPIPQGQRIHHAINPDPYRNPFEGTPEEKATKSAQDIEEIIRYSTPGQVAAFVVEPVQGVGGATHGEQSYLKKAFEIVRRHGGLCIADEVQSCFGRTGEYFGFQHFDVTPDIVVMAKGLGNGVPISAVTTRREIVEAMTARLHFNTFAGNPVSMAAGLAVMDVIEEDGLIENTRAMGARLIQGLRSLKEKHALIGDVRGLGLMIGVELVSDRTTKEPASAATNSVLNAAKERHVLLGKGGVFGNVIRIKPPLCISAEDVDYTLHVLDEALALC